MRNNRGQGSKNGRSELDIFKGRWAVRWRRGLEGQSDTRRRDMQPVYEWLASLLEGEYRQRRTMGDRSNEWEERERESVCVYAHKGERECDQWGAISDTRQPQQDIPIDHNNGATWTTSTNNNNNRGDRNIQGNQEGDASTTTMGATMTRQREHRCTMTGNVAMTALMTTQKASLAAL
ncbi:hypothetical protein EDB89DRAFT_1901969 [Lactarius sanguifluus]|nr:hypothetical protein EDB89DRAFT_1901969 [Lactarius sanguifluus]